MLFIGLTKIDDRYLYRRFYISMYTTYIILYIRYNISICLQNLKNLTTKSILYVYSTIHLLLPIDYGFGCNKSLT